MEKVSCWWIFSNWFSIKEEKHNPGRKWLLIADFHGVNFSPWSVAPADSSSPLEEGVCTGQRSMAIKLTLLCPQHDSMCVTCILSWTLESISPSYWWGSWEGVKWWTCKCNQQQHGFEGSCPLYSPYWAVQGQGMSFIRHQRLTGLANAIRTALERGIIQGQLF